MTSRSYLQNKLSVLADQFPDVTIAYGFDTDIDRHIVELTPEDQYYHNTSLDNAWIDVSLSFMEAFPMETISFISSDSTLHVQKPQLLFNGKEETADAANSMAMC